MLVGLAPVEARSLEFPAVVHVADGDDAERDMGRIQPVMGDRRFRAVHDRVPMHEGRRTEGRLSRQADVTEHGIGRGHRMAEADRQFHHQFVGMLAIDQRVHAVGGFSRREQQRITGGSHQRIGTEHRAQLQRIARTGRPACLGHHHPRQEAALVPARAALPVVHGIEDCVRHQLPWPACRMQAAMRRGVGLPGRAGRFTRHRIRAKRTGARRHRHRMVVRVVAVVLHARHGGGGVHVHVHRHFVGLVLRTRWRVLLCGGARGSTRQQARDRQRMRTHPL